MSEERIVGTPGLVFNEPLIFERGSAGRVGYSLPACDVPAKAAEALLPERLLRKVKLRGIEKVGCWFTLVGAAYNLIRLRRLRAEAVA